MTDNVCLAIPCYKRPDFAERYLDSVEKYVPYVKKAVVLLQPETLEYKPKERAMDVRWVSYKQQPMGPSRATAIKKAIELFNPEILWLSDDDIICTENTRIDKCLPLVTMRGIGVVGFGRQMNPRVKSGEGYGAKALLMMGGGMLVRRAVLEKIPVWFTDDVAEEKEFTLNVYLAGYTNLSTSRAYAIHTQGASGGGGIKQLCKDIEAGDKTLTSIKHTRFGPGNLLMTGTNEYYRTGTGKGILSIASDSKLTPLARSIHLKKKMFAI